MVYFYMKRGEGVQVNGLILAAGLSSRMGDFKPLMPLGGRTVIEQSVESMLQGGVAHVTVVVGRRAEDVRRLLQQHYVPQQLAVVENPRFEHTDMLESAKLGLRAMPACGAFFQLPGDVPAVAASTFFALRSKMDESGAGIVFPLFEGHREHPPLIAAKYREQILAYRGDGGLRALYATWEEDTQAVAVNDPGCGMDMDTQADYARLLAYWDKKQGAGE